MPIEMCSGESNWSLKFSCSSVNDSKLQSKVLNSLSYSSPGLSVMIMDPDR